MSLFFKKEENHGSFSLFQIRLNKIGIISYLTFCLEELQIQRKVVFFKKVQIYHTPDSLNLYVIFSESFKSKLYIYPFNPRYLSGYFLNTSTLIKPQDNCQNQEINIYTILSSNLQTLSNFISFPKNVFHKTFFSSQDPIQHHMCIYHVSPVSFNLELFLSLCL